MQNFLKEESIFKGRVWGAAPEDIGICINFYNTKIIHIVKFCSCVLFNSHGPVNGPKRIIRLVRFITSEGVSSAMLTSFGFSE